MEPPCAQAPPAVLAAALVRIVWPYIADDHIRAVVITSSRAWHGDKAKQNKGKGN